MVVKVTRTVRVDKDEWSEFLSTVQKLVRAHSHLLKESRKLKAQSLKKQQLIVKLKAQKHVRDRPTNLKEKRLKGAHIIPPRAGFSFCSSCGRRVRKNHRYCDKCGARILRPPK
ncbi:zinc ribbon domain-containing protein [[Eubacterium] cellulosolvens]